MIKLVEKGQVAFGWNVFPDCYRYIINKSYLVLSTIMVRLVFFRM